MISAFNKLVTYEGNEWEDYLGSYLLFDIFRPVISYYQTTDKECYASKDKAGLIKCAIRYIAHVYSIDSELMDFTAELEKNKERVYDYVNGYQIAEFKADLINLKCAAVVDTVTKWLTHQGDGTWQTYMMLKDLQQQMRQAAVSEIRKSSGEIDYDSKFKCSEYNVRLQEMIKDAEANLLQNNPKLKEAVGQIVKINKAQKNTMSFEQFTK